MSCLPASVRPPLPEKDHLNQKYPRTRWVFLTEMVPTPGDLPQGLDQVLQVDFGFGVKEGRPGRDQSQLVTGCQVVLAQ